MKICILTATILLLGASKSMAQTPFFAGGAVASDPVIAVATDGVSLNVGRAVVSADHKYVTLDMNPQLTSLGGFRNFTFQRPGAGFVGSSPATAAAARPSIFGSAPKQPSMTPSVAPTPDAVGKAATVTPSILDKPGLTCISSN